MKAIILDTETTDIEAPEVIELAWADWDLSFTSPGSGFHGYFSPAKPSSWGALAVHHILPEELEGRPPSSGAAKCVPTVPYWIGHNIDFDWKALGQPPVKRICTLALARTYFPNCDAHNQTALTYYIDGANKATRDMLRNAHSANADIELTRRLLYACIEQARRAGVTIDTLDQLWQVSESARVPTKFTFGKFRGQPISAADKGYANWYARQPDPDPYMIQAFKRARLL
jgi:exodeoxyribonuclease X